MADAYKNENNEILTIAKVSNLITTPISDPESSAR